MPARIATLLLVVFVISVSAQVPNDPRIGTWKINFEKSRFNPGPPPKSMTVRFEPFGTNGLRVTIDTVEAHGEVRKHTYVANYDGKDYAVSGDPGRDTVAHFIEGLDRVEAEQWRRLWPHFSLMP